MKKKQIPENVRIREGAAATCTKVIKRRVLKKQARKARTEHLVKCSLAPGKRKVRRSHCQNCVLTGSSRKTEKSGKESHRGDSEEVYTDQEEIREIQENRIDYFKKKGDQQFTDDGRKAEITVDLRLQARAKMSENKVNGPEDAVVSEMIKQLALEKIYTITKCFQECFMDQMEAPSSWKILKLVFLRKPDAEPKKRIRSYRAIALTLVMSK